MNIFCITSTINTTNNPWNYTRLRSFWTPEQRLEQTVCQIHSIRKLCNDSFIILSEGSILTQEQKNQLTPIVDVLLNDISDPNMYNAIHNSDLKGPGEIYELLATLDYIKANNLSYKRIFKITGRFSLNSNFILDNYSIDKMSFQYVKKYDLYNTILYSISPNYYSFFYNGLKNMLNDKDIIKGVEWIFRKYYPIIHNIETLGTEGYMGISNEYNIV